MTIAARLSLVAAALLEPEVKTDVHIKALGQVVEGWIGMAVTRSRVNETRCKRGRDILKLDL